MNPGLAPAADVALIGLGANLGDGAATLRAARAALRQLPDCAELGASGLYRSAPVDAEGPDFWNAVVALRCLRDAAWLLEQLLALELAHGRERPAGVHNAPRTLDLDLLAFGVEHRDSPRLTLPHPRMHLRAFVLAPLAEIAPAWPLPGGDSAAGAAARLCAEGQRIERVGAF